MIRMGRSSKTEPISESPAIQETFTANTSNVFNSLPSSTRAMSESESMARDIKEGRLSGFVGNGTVLTGETNFQAMLRVDGHLTGRVTSESGTLIIGSTGRVDANILVAAAIINGTINGDIVALEKIELGRSARVIGNIQTPRLVIEDGAIFEGSCTMLKAKENFDKKVFESRAAQLETNDLMPLEIHTGSINSDEDEIAEAANS
ncbi:MAG TPA: polymer-forming cytoskeletal protein [Pyrinomonadaceae bacterium]|nr:polymer-forming cytoskeletal protein [Pyrinomonadaceae bacterium]